MLDCLNNMTLCSLGQYSKQSHITGHPFMTSTRKSGFDSFPCPHVSTWAEPPPPCGRPHVVNLKWTSNSWNS